jgi:hypothetical protein
VSKEATSHHCSQQHHRHHHHPNGQPRFAHPRIRRQQLPAHSPPQEEPCIGPWYGHTPDTASTVPCSLQSVSSAHLLPGLICRMSLTVLWLWAILPTVAHLVAILALDIVHVDWLITVSRDVTLLAAIMASPTSGIGTVFGHVSRYCMSAWSCINSGRGGLTLMTLAAFHVGRIGWFRTLCNLVARLTGHFPG